MLRTWAFGLLFLIVPLGAIASGETEPSVGDVIKFMAKGTGITVLRDSGRPVTAEFLESCRKDVGPHYAKLECRDLVPIWHISELPNTGDKNVFAVTAERPSTEGRWVLEFRNGEFSDITDSAWPEISREVISERMISATGVQKYTADYLLTVAHSSYWVRHPSSAAGAITVLSGVPDDTFGTPIGSLRWESGSLHLE